MPLPCRNNNHTIFMRFPPRARCRAQKLLTECKTWSKGTISAATHCSHPIQELENMIAKHIFECHSQIQKKKIAKS